MEMTEANPKPSPDRYQAINAEYYNITDDQGWPIAALLVLLDRRRTPVRAELHLYEDLADELRGVAYRQGRSLLEQRYYSTELVDLRVLQSELQGEAVPVRANGTTPPPAQAPWLQQWQLLAGAAALVLLILLVWLFSSLLRSPSGTEGNNIAEQGGQPTPAAEQTVETVGAAAELPPSRNADSSLAIGMRVRVVSGLKLSLVAEPGANSTPVGFMESQQEANIVDGPVLTEGANDTIVWWRVQLDDGSQAWAPANTSEAKVLEPAP